MAATMSGAASTGSAVRHGLAKPPFVAGGVGDLYSDTAAFSPRTLTLGGYYQIRLVAALVVADLTALLLALMTATPVIAGHEWAVFAAGVGVAAALQCSGYVLGIYDVTAISRLLRGARTLLLLGLLSVATATLAVFGIAGPAPATRLALVGAAAVVMLLLLRLLVAARLDRRALDLAERVLLIGTSGGIAQLLTAGRRTGLSQRFVGVITIGDAEPSPIGVLAALYPWRDDAQAAIEDFWRIGKALHGLTRRIDRVVIAPTGIDDSTLSATLQRLAHLPCEIALAAPSAALGEIEDPFDRTNCLVLRRAAMTQWQSLCKRVFDILAASMLLVVLSPVLLVIAALIRRGSPGPALFRQMRWGLNNEPFTVFKFRTMWSDAAAADGSMQASRDDKRITPIGAFLRARSLDELPQLLNVLNGSMSLVGPRPHPVALNMRYLGVIDHYAGRHRVVPGITGLAQINGLRGETTTPSSMQKRIDLDLEYIRTRSFYTDMCILLKTVGSVIHGVNAH